MFIFKWFKRFFTDFFSTTPGEGVVPISNNYLPLTVVEYVYMGDGTVEAVTMTYEEAQEYYKNPWRWSTPTTSSNTQNTQSSSDSYDTNVPVHVWTGDSCGSSCDSSCSSTSCD
ncbi:hypothetical protein RB68_028 [Enterobacteria phage RB68]|uniref:Uncharacterized protein mrh.1 n=1 Tax=Enterobacteria phage RB51 TaxID=10693 RepID=C3V214_BPR51|nr:mrh.1 hypothetical protein [Enterobacteria phage RB51]YP_009167397.1 hypothetical protein RB68_028 [Enterobacteria phage RB68]ACP30946.1 mrh.1 hypothetical protein [Enterobacteria phage RB51]AIT75488.1 hypothetical protein RB68_028 [Enterobacteria phage RB68]UJJ74412.1 hypothetical protein CPTAc3_028 [Enterobacteria phage Ac3]